MWGRQGWQDVVIVVVVKAAEVVMTVVVIVVVVYGTIAERVAIVQGGCWGEREGGCV